MEDSLKEKRRLWSSVKKLSGEERLELAAMMFDAFRARILDSFPPGLSKAEIRRRLYERIYGEPLPADFLQTATRDL